MAKLLPITCPTCHTHLLDGPRGTQVYCQKCRRWVRAVTPAQTLIDEHAEIKGEHKNVAVHQSHAHP